VSTAGRLWAVVPAAGVGRRMGASTPKQYLDLAGRTVIEHTLGVLLGEARIAAVVVALDPDDAHWPGISLAGDPRIRRVAGGRERCHSVLSALDLLWAMAAPDDRVLVHDAARPCLRAEDLDRLIAELADDPVGGILAVSVRDTMKRAGPDGRIDATLDRSRLWHAYTPQLFGLAALREALRNAIAAGDLVTDEASAMERMGLAPRLVEGHADNLKITRPEDLALARFYLEQQGRLSGL
jgi:2-C-methyl-D-erythritol 4-phosphate cytidylyltransferase